ERVVEQQTLSDFPAPPLDTDAEPCALRRNQTEMTTDARVGRSRMWFHVRAGTKHREVNQTGARRAWDRFDDARGDREALAGHSLRADRKQEQRVPHSVAELRAHRVGIFEHLG